jgi:DNA-binding Lrp family transcriptional regulator
MRLDWTFLTNHAHVLICLARNPDSLLREVAAEVGITEGATQRIVADLVDEGYLRRIKVGRRNRYELHGELPLRHPLERDHAIGEILSIVGAPPPAAAGRSRRSSAD